MPHVAANLDHHQHWRMSVYSLSTRSSSLSNYDMPDSPVMDSPQSAWDDPQDPSVVIESSDLSGSQSNDNEPLRDIDSFLPILRTLPGVVLSEKGFGLYRAVSAEGVQELLAYTRTIGSFTLTDKLDPSDRPIEPGILVRLLQILSRNGPGVPFPSLQSLRIADGDLSLSLFWSFFLTPSLRSLEIAGVAQEQQTALQSFLIALADEAPEISSIKLGPGPINLQSMQGCLAFSGLRELYLFNEVGTIDYSFLEEVGKLSALEVLIFESATPVAYTCAKEPSTPTIGFLKLKILRLDGVPDMLQDFITMIGSSDLEDIALTLIPTLIKNGRLKKKKQSEPNLSSVVLSALSKWSTTPISIYASAWPQGASYIRFSKDAFQGLLAHGSLERLEIHGWHVNFRVDGALQTLTENSPSESKLRVLHLPVPSSIGGNSDESQWDLLSLSMLSVIGRACPNLISLQCGVKDLLDIPDYSISANQTEARMDVPNHSLEELSIGNPAEHPTGETDHLLYVAQYIDGLFPNLKSIKTHEGQNALQWKAIWKFVKMCQMTRSRQRALVL